MSLIMYNRDSDATQHRLSSLFVLKQEITSKDKILTECWCCKMRQEGGLRWSHDLIGWFWSAKLVHLGQSLARHSWVQVTDWIEPVLCALILNIVRVSYSNQRSNPGHYSSCSFPSLCLTLLWPCSFSRTAWHCHLVLSHDCSSWCSRWVDTSCLSLLTLAQHPDCDPPVAAQQPGSTLCHDHGKSCGYLPYFWVQMPVFFLLWWGRVIPMGVWPSGLPGLHWLMNCLDPHIK